MLDPSSRFLNNVKKYVWRHDWYERVYKRTRFYLHTSESTRLLACFSEMLEGLKCGNGQKRMEERYGRGIANTCTRCGTIDNKRRSHSAFPRVLCAENRTKAPLSPPSLFSSLPISVLSAMVEWQNEIDYIDERWNYSPRTKRKETAKFSVEIVKLGGCRLGRQ